MPVPGAACWEGFVELHVEISCLQYGKFSI